MQVLLTDAPIDDIAEAHVTIERVELVGEGEPIVVMDDAEEFDLLELQNGVTAELANEEVPAGTYHQIRLVVEEEATLVFVDGTDTTLKIPSGTETGIKLNLPGGFRVGEGAEQASVVLDFDASQSFVKAGASGMYIFKPVVQVESVEIEGEEIEDSAELIGEVTASDTSTVAIEGISLNLLESTDFDDNADGSLLTIGNRVEADVEAQSDGSLGVLEIERSDKETSVKAPIEEVLASAVVVFGTTFDVSSSTEFEGVSSLDDLAAGEFVRITFSYDSGAGAYSASKIGFEGDDEN